MPKKVNNTTIKIVNALERGEERKSIAKMLNISQSTLTEHMQAARDAGIMDDSVRVDRSRIPAELRQLLEFDEEMLRRGLNKDNAGKVHNVYFIDSRNGTRSEGHEDEEEQTRYEARQRVFGHQAASRVGRIICDASPELLGVSWGSSLARLKEGFQSSDFSAPTLRCFPTCGVPEEYPDPEHNSEILAKEFQRKLNPDGEDAFVFRGHVPARKPKDKVSKEIEHEGYRTIFCGDRALANRMNGLITSIGVVSKHRNDFWLSDVLRAEKRSLEQLATIAEGDISGVCIPKLGCEKEVDRINQRSTGLSRKQLEDVADRQPGLILLALGRAKREPLLGALRCGFSFTHLFLDYDLANEIWRHLQEHADAN